MVSCILLIRRIVCAGFRYVAACQCRHWKTKRSSERQGAARHGLLRSLLEGAIGENDQRPIDVWAGEEPKLVGIFDPRRCNRFDKLRTKQLSRLLKAGQVAA